MFRKSLSVLTTLMLTITLAAGTVKSSSSSSSSSRSSSSSSSSKPSSSYGSFSSSPKATPASTKPSAPVYTQNLQSSRTLTQSRTTLEQAKQPQTPAQSSRTFQTQQAKQQPIVVKNYRNYQPPAYVYNYPRSYGAYDAMLMWMTLDNMNHTMYYHHRQDPAWTQWRTDANKQAATDPALQAKLIDMDAKIAKLESEKVAVNPNYQPLEIETPQPEKSDGFFKPLKWLAFLLIFVGIGVICWKFYSARTAAKNYKPKFRL